MGSPTPLVVSAPAVPWSVEVDAAGPSRVVRVAGELDLATSAELIRAVERAADATAELVVDLRGVTFCDIVGAGALEQVEPWLAARGCRLTVLGSETAFGPLRAFGCLFPRLVAAARPLDGLAS